MNNPLVCICIPNYDNENTISQTLDSILNQKYKNIMIKVFDNDSTDGSMEILLEYKKKYANIQIFKNELNIGGEANFTKCIEGLEGDFGAIYHADDIYHPKMVETQVKYLQEKNISAVFVRANLIDDNSKAIGEQYFPSELKTKPYHQFNFKQLFSFILKYDNFLITPSVMAKTDIYKNQIKSWNGKKFKTSADLDVWLRFSEISNVGLITEKLISYRMSTASFSYRTKFSRITLRDMFLVTDFYIMKYKNIKFNKTDEQYLKFKDNLLVIGNKILNNINSIQSSEIVLCDTQLIFLFFKDKQKFKIFIYAILLKVLLFSHCNYLLNKFVRKVNHIPNNLKFEN